MASDLFWSVGRDRSSSVPQPCFARMGHSCITFVLAGCPSCAGEKAVIRSDTVRRGIASGRLVLFLVLAVATYCLIRIIGIRGEGIFTIVLHVRLVAVFQIAGDLLAKCLPFIRRHENFAGL